MTLKKILLTAFIFTFFYPAAAQTEPAKKEVLLVEIFGTHQWTNAKLHGMFLSWPDGKTEKINFGGCPDFNECILRAGPIIQKKFQELFNSGWKLENSAGGDQCIRYIFVR